VGTIPLELRLFVNLVNLDNYVRNPPTPPPPPQPHQSPQSLSPATSAPYPAISRSYPALRFAYRAWGLFLLLFRCTVCRVRQVYGDRDCPHGNRVSATPRFFCEYVAHQPNDFTSLAHLIHRHFEHSNVHNNSFPQTNILKTLFNYGNIIFSMFFLAFSKISFDSCFNFIALSMSDLSLAPIFFCSSG